MSPFNFGPASLADKQVFGASRPGYPSHTVPQADVETWLDFMRGESIRRLVCLLDDEQLAYYDDGLLARYRQFFGAENVLHVTVPDFTLASPETLKSVFRFLRATSGPDDRAVVHCSGGIGRTGHVLAGWLVFEHGLSPRDAIVAVTQTGASRNPTEAASERDLVALLEAACVDA